MTPSSGEVWIADLGAEARRAVYVITDDRFHRLAERALVAPVIESRGTDRDPPWRVGHDGSAIAVDRLTSVPIDRLLERQGTASLATVRTVQRTVRLITGSER